MKLTNFNRDAFIRAVMEDVPSVNYYEEFRKYLTQEAVFQLPDELKPIYKKYPDYFRTESVHTQAGCIRVPSCGNFKEPDDMVLKNRAVTEQQRKHKLLEEKLRNIVYGCSTLKQLEDALPEFKKYMPTVETKTSNLPAIANLVSDFTAAGWPKELVK